MLTIAFDYTDCGEAIKITTGAIVFKHGPTIAAQNVRFVIKLYRTGEYLRDDLLGKEMRRRLKVVAIEKLFERFLANEEARAREPNQEPWQE